MLFVLKSKFQLSLILFCFRFGRLVLLLPLLRMIRVETVEVLLFRETVGETGINNIILDVYNSHRLPLL